MVDIIISVDLKSLDKINALIKSIKSNVKDYKIHIITDKYVKINDCNIIVKDCHWKSPYERITGHTYHRLFLDQYLPDIQKCIWLDYDTLVLEDITSMLDGDDWMIKAVGDDYFNAGVLAFNFTNECKIKMEYCRSLINEKLDDQKILNIVFKNCFKPLPKEYNFMCNHNNITNPKILHFIGKNKPWFINKWYYEWLKYNYEFD